MPNFKIVPIFWALFITILVVSCSEKDQEVLPAVVDTEIELDDIDYSDNPRFVENTKDNDPSIQLQIDTASYEHHFQDRLKDYFYYNEVPSTKAGYRLFVGKWEWRNVVYNTSLTYNTTTKHVTVGADYRYGQNFYYSLDHSTGKIYSGIMSYVFYKYSQKTWSMSITWKKGGF